ncbi:hypothetical protein ACEWY4_022140 [Coilia grayii]|uniref:Chemokine interleukin-8-like domain-containing protein n=1 Tax=Coilia grayii TaxID=363190 RepID=A0ABD1J559_9TELE
MKYQKFLVPCILLALCTTVLGQHSFFPEKCCFRYYNKPIPRRSVDRILATSSQCVKPGLLVVVKNGKSLCVTPDSPNVSRLLRDFYLH